MREQCKNIWEVEERRVLPRFKMELTESLDMYGWLLW